LIINKITAVYFMKEKNIMLSGYRTILPIILFCILFFISCNNATECAESEKSPEIVKISENIFKIGNAVLDTSKGVLTVSGWINMNEGMVELLACGPKGKLHESVLVLDIEPYHLQVALLLLGLKPGGGLKYQGDPGTPMGDSLFVYVSWEKSDGNHIRVRGEDLIYDIIKKKHMERTEWVFSGSRFIDSTFMAALEQSYITTFHDPNTIIDNPLPTGGDDTLYEVNKSLVPPVNTKVTVELIKK
jgi:hypothetical protein